MQVPDRRKSGMAIQRWYPYTYGRWPGAAERLWRGVQATEPEGAQPQRWAIPVDVVEEEASVVVRASVPGIDPADIEVTIDGDVLTIKGETKSEGEAREGGYARRERRSGSFARTLRLSDALDREGVQPRYENGVLTVTIPRLEAAKPRRLTIAVGGGEAGSEASKAA
jgi:HSP20 family protein